MRSSLQNYQRLKARKFVAINSISSKLSSFQIDSRNGQLSHASLIIMVNNKEGKIAKGEEKDCEGNLIYRHASSFLLDPC